MLRPTLCIGLALFAAFAAPSLASAAVPPFQDGVRVERPVVAHAQPASRSRTVARLAAYTPFTISSQVLPVVTRTTSGGLNWVKVLLPTRPNGATGWIPANATKPLKLAWRIVVSTSRKRATTYRNGRVVRRDKVVVGAHSTPTPRGNFFVVERVKLHTSWANGLWALALSAHSNVFQEFEGGDGQVAIHAKGSLSAPLGTAASHGCIRVANKAAAWMARRIPNGTPVDVR